ncbi:MAG: replicative DNA helicase [Myxococcota bacterium]|nr:replicative DNA helicase [Myxococcota bacterium]
MSVGRHLEAREAEQAVLGAILLDNGALDRVAESLGHDDFYLPQNKIIFEAMISLSDESKPIDTVTLATRLDQQSQLEDIGGMEYLLALDQTSATAINVGHHAKIVHDLAELRRLISACTSVVEKAQGGDYEDQTILFDEAQQLIFEIGAKQNQGSFVAMNDALKDVLDNVRNAFENKIAVTGTPTGFTDLDNLTSGLNPGDLVILAGRPGMGKTAVALNMASNAARMSGCTVAVFSLEMPTAQLAARMLACEAEVNSRSMRTGHLVNQDIERLVAAVRRMNDWSIEIDDTAGSTIMEVRSKCRRLASDRNLPPLGLVLIDYLQLMRSPTAKSREQEISEISRNLKGLAKELGIPVVALSQLNRGVESRPNKRPMMSDLRESGAIEQDADIIMFVYRDEYYNEDSEDKGLAELIVAKQRNGPLGTVKLKFFIEHSRFVNLKREFEQ